MGLSIVFYEIVVFVTIIYALYRTPLQAFSGIPTRDESETPRTIQSRLQRQANHLL